MSVISTIFNWVDERWEALKKFGSILKPCRFSVILLVIVAIILVTAQGQDVLRAMTETDNHPYTQIFWFFLGLFLWATNTWYWARVMLRFKFEKNEDQDTKTRKYLPRALGVLTFIVTALAFYKTDPFSLTSFGFALFCLALGGAFLYILIKRIPVLHNMYSAISKRSFGKQGKVATLITMLEIKAPEESYNVTYRELKDVPPATWMMLGLLALISFALFFIFLFSMEIPVLMGTAAIILLAAASWIAFGSAAVYFGTKKSFPIITVLFILAIIFSRWNDNHRIRYLDTMEPKRENIAEHSKKWFERLNDNKGVTPYFVIAAEGGGIRAAYWAALVLSEFQDRNANFSQHLYAISGVSGGSLGAATFAGALHEWTSQQTTTKAQDELTLKCKLKGQPNILTKKPFRRCTTAVLSNDFLSPAAAYMLYPDLIQRFLPCPVPSFDRSRALEGSWELAWSKVFPANEAEESALFGRSFFDMWKVKNSNTSHFIPSLFLNATWVETGKRVIASNLAIDHGTFSDSKDFFDVLKRDIRLSSAIHNSARFTYVSPAGTVYLPEDEKVWGHLVDGGYFENSGASTAYDVLTAIINNNSSKERIKPVVIVITNDPSVKSPCDKTKNGCEPNRFLNELYSPIGTLLATRGARGSYARTEIKNFVTEHGGLYLEISLCGGKGPLPLGWSLSDKAKENMDNQLNEYIKEVNKSIQSSFDPLNYEHLKALKAILDEKCKRK